MGVVAIEKTTTVNQTSDSIQIISDIEVAPMPWPGYCPANAPPSGYNFQNKKTLDMKTIVDVSNVSSSEISRSGFGVVFTYIPKPAQRR